MNKTVITQWAPKSVQKEESFLQNTYSWNLELSVVIFTAMVHRRKKKKEANISLQSGDVAQLAEHQTGTLPTQVRFPGAARDFSPTVNFQCRLSYDVRTPPCATACINICAHVKDPVVHVRLRWIMETLKHPACTVGWVARLCRSWLSLGKATRIFHGRNSIGTIQL